MAQIDQREKTLVFCATQDHALAIRDAINQIKTSSDPDYCQRVTANDGAGASNGCATSRTTRRPSRPS
jgi:type I restriction enzyme R subunit